ncbi:hypothetical protein J437_LFUL015621 [Ladona fulva]|uniref:DUF5641 domain-containing protein n=1 Tax=Ladona fulva TaxID=123851 RepID=A0A8K0P4S1_LADFU|nr:hypothetical protein J437_LFUL015621 [Ladona fulva]
MNCDANAFIATFKRFTSCRGHFAALHSDQGRNFVGTDMKLKRFFEKQNIRCLYSHPLIPLTDDIADLQLLRPAYFKIDSSSFVLPEPRITEDWLPLLKCWLLVTQMLQYYCDHWVAEYLQNLQRRLKWATPSLAIGDIVLIKKENTTQEMASCSSDSAPQGNGWLD